MRERKRSSVGSNRRTIKLGLSDGSIQEIEYEIPIDRYDLLRTIYHDLKYDGIYDWNTFYESTTFTRSDSNITTLLPVINSSDDVVYILTLPDNKKSKTNNLFNYIVILIFKLRLICKT